VTWHPAGGEDGPATAGAAGAAGVLARRTFDLPDWGFALAAAGPVAIWQGDQDLMVPRRTAGGWPAASAGPGPGCAR
jgi:hypothetical protein